MAAADQFKINLNQNLWGLVVGLVSLGAAEHFDLHTLYWFSLIISAIMSASAVFTTWAYTVNYWRNKMKKDEVPPHN